MPMCQVASLDGVDFQFGVLIWAPEGLEGAPSLEAVQYQGDACGSDQQAGHWSPPLREIRLIS